MNMFHCVCARACVCARVRACVTQIFKKCQLKPLDVAAYVYNSSKADNNSDPTINFPFTGFTTGAGRWRLPLFKTPLLLLKTILTIRFD